MIVQTNTQDRIPQSCVLLMVFDNYNHFVLDAINMHDYILIITISNYDFGECLLRRSEVGNKGSWINKRRINFSMILVI